MPAKPATVMDVARLAGVSRQTVSNALNTPERLKGTTLARVLQAAADLDYTPNPLARGLRTGATGVIAITSSAELGNLTSPGLDSRLALRVATLLSERGNRVLVLDSTRAAEANARLLELVRNKEIDALVGDRQALSSALQELAADNGVKAVYVGKPSEAPNAATPFICIDPEEGMQLAADHLENIAGGPIAYLGIEPHRELFTSWATFVGVQASSERDFDHGLEAASRILANNPDLVGMICETDILAAAGVAASVRLARNQLLVTGFGNTPVSEAIGISSLDFPYEDVALQVVEHLSAPTPRRSDAHYSLVSRESITNLWPEG